MALQAQYVNCRELHNPYFTPQTVRREDIVFLNNPSQALETAKDSNAQLLSLSGNSATIAEALPHPLSNDTTTQERQDYITPKLQNPKVEERCTFVGPLMSSLTLKLPAEVYHGHPLATENLAISCGTAIPLYSPSILASPNVSHVRTSSLENPTEPKSMAPKAVESNDQSISGFQAGHATAECKLAVSELSHDTSAISDHIDDVQFILSVPRKRKRKGPQDIPFPNAPAHVAGPGLEKETPKNINSQPVHEASLVSQTTRPSLTASHNLSDPAHGMRNPQGSASSPSPSGFKASGPAMKKRKSDKDEEMHRRPQDLRRRSMNRGPIPIQPPFPCQPLLSQQGTFRLPSFVDIQHVTGNQTSNTSQGATGFRLRDSTQSHSYLSLQNEPNAARSRIPFQAGYMGKGIQETSTASEVIDRLRSEPSLYTVPQWQTSSPTSGTLMPSMSKHTQRNAYGDPLYPWMYNFPVSHVMTSGPVAGSTRSIQLLAPTPQTGQLKRSPAPNMIVDIAQTCQDNFPFALIAKRHNQPIQKVFDTFSAVVQLPLLRSAVDARRPGQLGSQRMKDFRAMKKGMKGIPKGKPTSKKRKGELEKNATSGN